MAKGIYKRGNVYWICFKGLDGSIIRESSGDSDYRDAQTLLNRRRREIDEGKEVKIKKIAKYTFTELAEKYLLWINGRHRTAKTKAYIIQQLVNRYGNLPLRNFNTDIVEQFQTDLINRNLKNASVNKQLSILKAMFKKAVDWSMVERSSLEAVRAVEMLPEDKRLRFISVEECQRLTFVCEPHLRPIVLTALNTGMRKTEILSLKWDRVDLQHGFIMLDKTKNHERREIPINDTLRGVFQGTTRRTDVPYVFYEPKTGIRYKDIKRSFATALSRAKIIDFKFHDLRHTFASHLVMSGVDITTVSRLLGHKSLKMTLRYSHLAPAHLKNAVNILDTTMTGKPSTSQFTSQSSKKELSHAG